MENVIQEVKRLKCIEARKGVKKEPNLKILPPLIVYDENNQWTNDILKIYNYKKEE